MHELIKRLSEVSAPSGGEAELMRILKDEVLRIGPGDGVSIECAEAFDGSLAVKLSCHDNAPDGEHPRKLAVTCSVDEVGFMVKSHGGTGMLRIAPVGIKDPALLVGRRVTVSGVRGSVGAVPVHLSKGKSVPDMADVYVDVGCKTKKEAVETVPLGSFGGFDTGFSLFGAENSLARGKALSGRAPAAVILTVLECLARGNVRLPYEIYFVFIASGRLPICASAAVMERLGVDCVISVGSRPSGDTPVGDSHCRVGGGVCLPFAEEKYEYDVLLSESLKWAAESARVNVQRVPPRAGLVDYSVLRMKNAGLRVASVSVPVRYMESACEVVSLRDTESCAVLLREALNGELARFLGGRG